MENIEKVKVVIEVRRKSEGTEVEAQISGPSIQSVESVEHYLKYTSNFVFGRRYSGWSGGSYKVTYSMSFSGKDSIDRAIEFAKEIESALPPVVSRLLLRLEKEVAVM